MGRKKSETKVTQVSARIPSATVHDIDVLIRNGFFKDRSDFAQQAIREYLEMMRKKLAGRIVELESPPLVEPYEEMQRMARHP